mmetsp:Transcript_19281/g.45079  ORF Transcript_19281/g.45079 Transcript_19281/m.45079 type:complete len:153 (-) Transcript_19281:257-715(-)
MSKVGDSDSVVIIQRLLLLMLAFYVFNYILCIIIIASLPDVEWSFLGKLPFWHEDFGPGAGDLALAAWLSMGLSLLANMVFIYSIGRSTRMAWDYAVTMSILHFVLTCLVTLEFPTNWAWWVTWIIATLLVFVGSELSCYYLRDLRELNLDK